MSKILQFPTSPSSFMKPLMLLNLIRHGATISSTGDNSLSRKATGMLHGTIRTPKPHSIVLADSSHL